MDYQDFVVALMPGAKGRFQARVEASPAGKAGERIDLPPALVGSGLRFGRPVRHVAADPPALPSTRAPEASAVPEDLGHALYRALFAGEIGRLLDESLGMTRQASQGLRIRLRMDLSSPEAVRLHGLPWELLHRGPQHGFLTLQRSNPLVRDLIVARADQPQHFVFRLRILVVLAAPGGLARLELEREGREIVAAWGRSVRVAVTLLRHPTLERLRETLLGDRFHAIHFMGHGDFYRETSSGVLYFEGEGGEPRAITGTELAEQLGDIESLRLVVLNACETAMEVASPKDNPFSGVATALVRAGVAAVVAMQLPISDAAAVAFSRVFYRRLAAGDPVDCALAESRLAVHRILPESWEWAIPVLFLRSGDGRILVRLWLRLVFGLAVMLALLALTLYLVLRPLPQPTRLAIEDDGIQVFDEANRAMWTRQVRGPVREGVLEDLDGDGDVEVIVGVDGREEDAGKILVFDRKASPRWVVDTRGKIPFSGGGRSGRMAIRAMAVGDLFDSGERQIVSLSLDVEGWYPSRLCVWSAKGRLLGEYWHPGHLHFVRLGRRRAGEPMRIIAAGVNNDLTHFFEGTGYPRALLLLDPGRVEGQAPPYFGDAPRGSHLWYKALLPQGVAVTRLEVTDRDQDGESEIMVWMKNGTVLYFDFDGHLLSRARADSASGVSQVFDVR